MAKPHPIINEMAQYICAKKAHLHNFSVSRMKGMHLSAAVLALYSMLRPLDKIF